MYHIRYYAIGHSYLQHGPFPGWQTEGLWGMAASDPENDYFHRFQAYLKEHFDCRVEAVAENHATYERRCVADATVESYESSPEYAHMKKVLSVFQPNLISLFLGDGNTVAKDEESAALFFDTLYKMIQREKRADAVVVCVCFRKKICHVMRAMAEKYGFLAVDASFIHEKKGYDNPYYAFGAYPEYDERAAAGAVEFRTHPGDLGHDAIAQAMFDAVREQIPARIAEGELGEPYRFAEYVKPERLSKFSVKTEPEMFVKFYGFNVQQEGDCVVFGSAPKTGASVAVDGLHISDAKRFYMEMAVSGVARRERLCLTVTTSTHTVELACDLTDEEMHRYEFDLSEVDGEIHALRISPAMTDCVLTVKAMGFQ